MRIPFLGLGLVVVVSMAGYSVRAQDAAPEQGTDRIVAVAKKSVANLSGTAEIDGQAVALKAVGPIHICIDPAFKINSCTMWIWGDSGRPDAIMSMATIDTRRFFEFHSFSDHALTFPVLGRQWQPEPAWRPVAISDAPEPDASPTRRLSQMKRMTDRFRASEKSFQDGQVYQMRILPTPVYRYPNPTQEKDGAIFLFNRDADPEVVLIIETAKQGWQFMIARLSAHVPTVYFDEKPYMLDYPWGPREPYFFTFRTAEKDEDPVER